MTSLLFYCESLFFLFFIFVLRLRCIYLYFFSVFYVVIFWKKLITNLLTADHAVHEARHIRSCCTYSRSRLAFYGRESRVGLYLIVDCIACPHCTSNRLITSPYRSYSNRFCCLHNCICPSNIIKFLLCSTASFVDFHTRGFAYILHCFHRLRTCFFTFN